MQGSARLGALLRECREAQGMSIDDLSRATRIGPRHLLALEDDRFRELPAPVFVRGFIRSYCAAVNEPAERALALYDDVAKAPRGPSAVPRTVLAEPAGARGHSRFGWRRLVVACLVVVIGGAVYLIASSASSRPPGPARPRDDRPAAGPPAAPRPEPVAVAVTGPAAPPAAAPPAAAPPDASRPHVLIARAHEPTWVAVRADDGSVHQELLGAGTVREWQSLGRFSVTVGNAAALTLELDGVALPPLGGRGQVIRDVRIPREPTP